MTGRARPAARLRGGATETLLFDLDGTLVDSQRDLAAAINALRAELGLGPLALESVRGMVGRGARRLVEQATAKLASLDLDRALSSFLQIYERMCTDSTRPYPGIEEMLEQLVPHFPSALLTNKPEGLARRILRSLELESHFRVVVGGDTLRVRKPHPEVVRWLGSRLDAAVERMLLVGDSEVDAATAAAGGCRFALVEWGFASAAERESLSADVRLARPRDLVDLLLSRRQCATT